MWLLEAKMVYWLYEQPDTSLMFEHPRMQQVPYAYGVLWCSLTQAHLPMVAIPYSPQFLVATASRSSVGNRG